VRYSAFICPNSGHVIIEHIPSDNKVICDCGKPNPDVSEGMQRVEVRDRVHYKSGLRKAFVEVDDG